MIRLIVFFILNFGALALGGLFTGAGVKSDWYATLNKASWTPPGWVFGFAWTSIMICFSFYMMQLWTLAANKKLLIILFTTQWVLNVIWNPVFFYYHQSSWALIVIVLLTLLMGLFFYLYISELKLKSLLVLPYFLWLLIATSLNAFIVFKN